jgi:hypothetical protein
MVKEKIKATIQLNPLPAMTPEQKDEAVLSGTILKEDAIISNYIQFFVEKATQEHEDFLEMEYEEKYKIIQGYAQEKLTAAEDAQAKKDKASQETILAQIDAKRNQQAA